MHVHCTLYNIYNILLSKGIFNRSTSVLQKAQKHTSTWEFCKLLAL